MGARCRLPWAALGLASALAAGCSSTRCLDSNGRCVVDSAAMDETKPMAYCGDSDQDQLSWQQVADASAGPALVDKSLGQEIAEQAACPPQEVRPPQVRPPVVEKTKRAGKHAARRKHHPHEQKVESIVVIGPESQFVPVPTRPVFGPRLNPRLSDEIPPGLLPVEVPRQIMPAPGGMPMPGPMPGPGAMPAPSPEDSLPKPGTSSTTSKKPPAKNAVLTSSLQILK